MHDGVQDGIDGDEITNDLVVIDTLIQGQVAGESVRAENCDTLPEHQKECEGTGKIETLATALGNLGIVAVASVSVKSTSDQADVDEEESEEKDVADDIVLDVGNVELPAQEPATRVHLEPLRDTMDCSATRLVAGKKSRW